MAELTSNVTDTALVFEGGGMRAAYTSAVVTTLLDAGIFIDWVGGISAGSSNLANYLSRDKLRARHTFVEFANDPNIGDWRTFARGDGLFNAEYIYEHTSAPDEALPFDWDTFQANPARFRIGSFDCETGETLYWGRDDVPTLRDLLVRVRASSTMPVVMPPVNFEGKTYVDGALGTSGGIPLDAAQSDGMTKFLVILTQPRDYVKKPVSHAWAYRAHFRRFPAVAEALATRHERYNATREQLFELEKQGKAYLFFPEIMPIGNNERSVPRLEGVYAAGIGQAERELPAIKEFLGV